MTRQTITPEIIANILAKAPARYADCHRMNLSHPLVRECKLGAVFVDASGNYCVYVGLCGQNRKFPVMFVRVDDRATRKATLHYLAKIAAASK